MRVIFYNDPPLKKREPRSIFLAGPTGRNVIRTPWRKEAVELLSQLRPEGMVILPEFLDRKFDRAHFLQGQPDRTMGPFERIPNMRLSSSLILDWETDCIDNCDVLLAWMPFSDDLPGRTTRSEVSRAIEQVRHNNR